MPSALAVPGSAVHPGGGERDPLMTRYLTRDRVAIVAAVAAPLAAAVVLLPWRGSWSNTNVALLLLLLVVVAVAAIGNRAAGGHAALAPVTFLPGSSPAPGLSCPVRGAAWRDPGHP